MEQYVDEYLRDIFGESISEKKIQEVNFKNLGNSAKEYKSQIKKAYQTGELKGGTNPRLSGAKEVMKVPGVKPVAGALAAGVLGAGILAAKKYGSAANRACTQYYGKQKDACIAKYKAGSFKAEMLSLKENSIICNASQDKDSCFRLVAMRIMELQKLISN